MERELFYKVIDELRQDLIKAINEYGLGSSEALLTSQKLDRILNIYYQTQTRP